jgi:RNA recognition motif-containing protein
MTTGKDYNLTKRGNRMEGGKLYVGNLSYSVTNEEIKQLFSQYGEVRTANVIEGKGFGFIEMNDSQEAEKAMKALNGSDFKGRAMRIEEAKPQKPRQSKGYGSGRY